MDPITRMAEDFMKAWLRFRQSAKARLFRIDTDPSMHVDLWRLFRAIEMSPDNRSPYLIFNKSFISRKQFFQEAGDKLLADYALLQEGLAKDGVTVGKLALPPEVGSEPEEQFAALVDNVWEQMKSQFEYLMIIFLPEKVGQKEEWILTIQRLLDLFSSSKVRLAVGDNPDHLLAGISSRLKKEAHCGGFFMSSKTLQQYLLKAAAGGWGALSDGKGQSDKLHGKENVPSPKVKEEPEGQPISSPSQFLSPSDAKRLRICMAKAASASSEQKPADAIEALREAQAICNANGLATHEAIILMAIANSFLGCENIDESLVHYEGAAKIADQAGSPVVVMQARMGAASALFHAQRYELAAQAYAQAAEDALAAESEVMRIEALRMAGSSYAMADRFDGAIECWSRALQTGEKISSIEIGASTFEQVGAEFAALCERRGLTEQAKSVKAQVEALRQRATARDPGPVELVESLSESAK